MSLVQSLRDRPNRVNVRPGTAHWAFFADLVAATGAPGLRRRSPLDAL